MSPDTDEFVRLERRLATDEDDEEAAVRRELAERLEERRRSADENSSAASSLALMERRGLRQFGRADEYLYAMKEDLAEWLAALYPEEGPRHGLAGLDADNFLDRLENGEHLVRVSE